MKTFILTAILSLPMFSHALAMDLALCETADGQYKISVIDDQGTGPVRSSNISAEIITNGHAVATYMAKEFKGPDSISFGRHHYLDVATEGNRFLLSGPSTNFKHFSIDAQTPSGRLHDDNLKCSIFNGRPLRN